VAKGTLLDLVEHPLTNRYHIRWERSEAEKKTKGVEVWYSLSTRALEDLQEAGGIYHEIGDKKMELSCNEVLAGELSLQAVELYMLGKFKECDQAWKNENTVREKLPGRHATGAGEKPDFRTMVKSRTLFALFRATCPEAKYRNARDAMELARSVCELSKWSNHMALVSLAAAYAESGDFGMAVKYQEQAIAAAPEEQRQELKRTADLYRHSKPWRYDPRTDG
jgi:tetratricopeptide (TPR) repeat protein